MQTVCAAYWYANRHLVKLSQFGICRLFKLVLIVTRNFLLDSVSAVKITFIVESVINVCMVRHYLTRALCDKLSWKFLLFPFAIVILVLWCSCFILSSTDLRHICQNLNQFGHGRGTIYGGRVDWMLTYLLKINLQCFSVLENQVRES